MELEENSHGCKRSRVVGNGSPAAKIGRKERQEDDEEHGERKGSGVVDAAHLAPWQHHPSSRIFRVSRASGGKDRHSKVYTAKGLRDRRVRLSVSTAIQFYDLQDRLGYDQPSKAIEWLIKAAAAAINELPPLNGFPKLPHLNGDEIVKTDQDIDPSYNQPQQQQHLSTKSGCSSTSETSKGSVLSLSRSESRLKARERARERAAKDKVKDRDDNNHIVTSHQQNLNPETSFTALLINGGSGSSGANIATVGAGEENSGRNCVKQISTADYFSQAGLFSHSQKNHQLPSGFSSQSHFGNSSPMGMLPFNIAATGDHPEMQQFSFLQDHLYPVSADYNLNFSISSGLAGLSRGTLQSNSPAQLPQQHHNSHNHLQRLSSTLDGSNLQFFFGAAAGSAAATTSTENQFPAGFDGRLQLCYGDGYRHSDLKGKGKS
ncbi:hypothetical protein Cni_G08214 [Canna indica]|uniref:Transcription factor TCP2-like n=1 Tax=Canna indica TaxID=4628 RepID=A0AAQ3Q868_9LILI|nr:hypothetical protein Cni_G08214 [Canna indica]